ncbi:MAG: NAD(P)/FAD-dependent oxidoreductase [Thermodesulfobacteriota bacterium]|nr:NAD(P)/FAD-dependent oxidoreductase [Thermodesulfobacteriota bacterium]
MKAEVVVIGSGISGLTAAASLTKRNRQVVIVERNQKPGGALKHFVRRGIPFDVGFHYSGCLGPGGILRVLWEYLGVWSHLRVHSFPSEGNDRLTLRHSRKSVRAFFSYERLEDELQQAFPIEAEGVATYLKALRDICDSIPFYNLDLPLTPFLRGPLPSARIGLAPFLTSLTKDPDLQAVLASPAFLYGVPPRQASLAVHAMVAHAFISGAYAIDGGGQAIVDAFLATLAEAGVDILTGQEVESVLVKENQVAGVKTSEGEIYASHVIYTGHPTSLLDMVPDGIFRKAFYNRMRNLINTDSMFVVFGAVDDPGSLDDLTWVNHYAIPSGLDILDVNLKYPEESALLMTAPGRRYSGPALSDAQRGIILMRPASWDEVAPFSVDSGKARPTSYKRWKARCADRLLDQAKKLWGYSRIEPLAIGSPLTFRDKLGVPGGAVYGVQHCLNQYNPGAKTRLSGLWLSGQGTLMTGIVGASLSGLVTVGEIEGLEPLWDEVRQCR